MKQMYWKFGLFAVIAAVVGVLFTIDATAGHTAAAVAGLAGHPASMLMDPSMAGILGAGAIGRLSMQQMREKRNDLSKETRNLLDKNTHDKWDDASQKTYDDNVAEIDRLDAAITREQRILDLSAEKHFKDAGGKETDLPANSDAVKIYNKWLRGGDNAISAEEWSTIRNTMSTTTPGEGGYTVQTDVAKSILDALKAYGGMREVSEVIVTAQGNPMSFPTSDGTSEEGEIVAENGAVDSADASFSVKSLSVYKYSSKVITVPIELLQDSASDIEAFVRQRLAARLGRITNKHFTTGTGSGQPNGVVTASAAGKAGAVSATPAITYDDLVDLEHSVDPAYRALAKWMMHDQTVKLIRKLKDSAGRPIWVPSYDGGISKGAAAELLGKPLVVNQHMATPAASAKTVLHGDFSYYKIRDVMAISLFRFTDSAYAKNGQVGFLAFMRTGGNLVDVGGAVKHFVHGAAS